jgi:hypothetical protein
MRHLGNPPPPREPLLSALIALVLLGLITSLYSFQTASNLLEGDDWRFLTIFYKKWIDHTLEFRDLFADQHPILLHPIVYLFNAKVLSLQMKFGAYLGMAAKFATAGLLLWRVQSCSQRANPSTLNLVLLLCILSMFFGMNETVEYSWALLTYECNVFFLVAVSFSILLDRVLKRRQSVIELALLFAAGLAAILLLGTLIKLFLLAALVALAPLVIFDGLNRRAVVGITVAIGLVIVVHTEFIRLLQIQNIYDPMSFETIAGTVRDLPKLVMNVGYGLAAGILNWGPIEFPSRTLALLAILLEALVTYAIVIFYREQMWKITAVPIVLVFYYLLTLAGAVLFRPLEVDSGWPLYIPRYLPYYHVGWVGVIWIYYIKAQSVTHATGTASRCDQILQ